MTGALSSRNSPCASRAWTRFSSASPAAAPATKTGTKTATRTAAPANWKAAREDRDLRHRSGAGAGAGAKGQPAQRDAEHLHAHLAQRAEDQDEHGGRDRPELAADHVPAAVHLRLRRRHRPRQHARLPAV